jgi:hypothetical protein
MAKSSSPLSITEEGIVNKIYVIRGKKIMLDRDLAELYGVQTRVLNQAVRRNMRRFPLDFMFVLTDGEFKNLISQSVISSWGGSRKLPVAFTEQGVAMLSSVLNSDSAIEVNIQIIRIFTRMREMLLTHKDILLKLEQAEKKMIRQDGRLNKHDQEIRMVFDALKKLLKSSAKEQRPRVGFRRSNED